MSEFLPTLTVAGILGLLAPLATSALKRYQFSPKVNQIIAVVVSVLLAVVAILATDGFADVPGHENPVVFFLTCAFIVIAVAQLAYRLIWDGTPIEQKLASIGSNSAPATPVATGDTPYQGKHEL